VRIVPLDERTVAAWLKLFDACGCACHCRWWHYEGTKNDWLARCAQEPERNRDEQVTLVRDHAAEARGLLAMDCELAIGWLKLTPRRVLPKLFLKGPYRSIDPASDDGVWSVGCMLVEPSRRRGGVARSLVEAAGPAVRSWGGTAVEAYPRRADRDLHDEEAWMGTAAMFSMCGYAEVGGEGAYPVMRLVVRGNLTTR